MPQMRAVMSGGLPRSAAPAERLETGGAGKDSQLTSVDLARLAIFTRRRPPFHPGELVDLLMTLFFNWACSPFLKGLG